MTTQKQGSKGKIYVLLDPDTKAIRYVGMTKLTLQARLYLHTHDLRKLTHKRNWIKSLLDVGKEPLIELIDTADTLEETVKKELYWINYHLNNGENLTNYVTTYSNRPYKSFRDSTAKRVVKYDLKGNELETYDTALQAACEAGNCESNGTIYSICNGGKSYTYKGYVYRYEGDTFDKFKIVKPGEHVCPEYHKLYLAEQARERNKGYDREHYVRANSMIKNRRGTPRKSVIKVDTGEEFDSIMIASDKTGVPKTTISRHCNNKVNVPKFKFKDIVQADVKALEQQSVGSNDQHVEVV